MRVFKVQTPSCQHQSNSWIQVRLTKLQVNDHEPLVLESFTGVSVQIFVFQANPV